MPDPKRIRAYYDGDDDRVVLECLESAELMPTSVEIAIRDKKHQGKEGLVYQLSTFVRPINGVAGSAIALVDLDEHDVGELTDWFQKELQKNMPSEGSTVEIQSQPTDRPNVSRISLALGDRQGEVALVAVGLCDDRELRDVFGIEEFAIDDHIFRLCRDADVFAAIPDFKDVTHEVAMRKLSAMATLLRENGIAVRRSKRFLHLLRAIVGFRASSAAFVSRLLTKAHQKVGSDRVRELLTPLVDDVEEAVKVVSG